MSLHYQQRSDYVVYSPEYNLIFLTQATFNLDVGIYYKMYSAELDLFVVVVNLGAL